MTNLDELAQARESLKAAKEKASEKLTAAKQAFRTARNEANRAIGQKLPNASEAQATVDAAKKDLNDADAQYRAFNDAYQAAIKKENDAIKEKKQEDAVNEVMSSYDLAVEEDSEYFGIFYDENLRYVGFDIGIAGRAEASYNVSDVNELNDIIAKLTEMAQKMS